MYRTNLSGEPNQSICKHCKVLFLSDILNLNPETASLVVFSNLRKFSCLGVFWHKNRILRPLEAGFGEKVTGQYWSGNPYEAFASNFEGLFCRKIEFEF